MSDPLLAVGTWAMVPCVDRIFTLPQAPGILNTGPGAWTGMVKILLVGIEGVGPIFDTGGNRSVIDYGILFQVFAVCEHHSFFYHMTF